MLTKKQTKVLQYIKTYIEKHKFSPTLEEICEEFKLSSVSTASHYQKKTKRSGVFIEIL